MKIVSKFHVPIFYAFREISRQIALRSGWARSGRFIVLNDSASPKMVIEICFKFFRLFFYIFRVVRMLSRLAIYDCQWKLRLLRPLLIMFK